MNVAKATIQKNTKQPPIEGETTKLYDESANVLQELANETGGQITEKFGTVNKKMKAWVKQKGHQVGFEITEDEIDGRTVKAQRTFTPLKTRP